MRAVMRCFPSGRGARTLIAAVVGIIGVAFGANESHALEMSPKRECAICHIMWVTDFKRTDVTPLVPYDPRPKEPTGRQDISSTPRMCFSCHDGFVLDSRFAWLNKHNDHPIGIEPSDKVKLPTKDGKTLFPLNEDGKLYCGTCHTAHGVDWRQEESPVFLRAKNIESGLCLACHLDQSTGQAEGNHPIFEPMDKSSGKLKKAGAKFGRDESVVCQSCHRVHGGQAKKLLVLNNQKADLCNACHENKRQLVNSKHDLSVMEPEALNRVGQSAKDSGPCGACHIPHGSLGPNLWAAEIASDVDPTASRCLSCHRKEGLAKDKPLKGHNHPLNVEVSKVGIKATRSRWSSRHTPGKAARLTPLPLYDQRGQAQEHGGRLGCGTCHDPHNWSPTGAAVKDPHKVEGGSRDSFLRLSAAQDGRLCTNCHVDKGPVIPTKHNLTISAVDSTNALGQTPAQSGACGTCHTTHNAARKDLWARDTGPGDGASEVLCSSCHRTDGIAGDRLTGQHSHPLRVSIKDDVSTRLPLYPTAVKGRHNDAQLDCGTCHDPHQWDPTDATSTAGADAKVEGDASNSFLRLSASGSAPLCADCHRAQKMVARTDHDLSVTAPSDLNGRGQTAAQSGVCGQCHAVHKAPQRLHLWARELGDAPDVAEQLCRSCHAEHRVAEGKQPVKSRHPEDVTVWSDTIRARFGRHTSTTLPIYHDNGEQAARGIVTCASCHNPHQWDPRDAAIGPGKNTEGDTQTSFLRLANSESFLCADCHGLDGLFRYKYFHGETSRKDYPLYR
ncbi:MAG: cytochrome c3 family protein [Gammaproteobacteria bacterium]|nr:cytochrome c3 family protein [Gammaproteobacteria bacterium]